MAVDSMVVSWWIVAFLCSGSGCFELVVSICDGIVVHHACILAHKTNCIGLFVLLFNTLSYNWNESRAVILWKYLYLNGQGK